MTEKVCRMQSAISNQPNCALKILVCYHKKYTLPNLDDEILLPIQVGKSLTDTDLHIQADNEVNGQSCDNISDKNYNYAELTALYWAWKNIRKIYPDVKYVGISHYRRLFAFDEEKFFVELIRRGEQDITSYKVNAQKVIDILDKGNVIISKRVVLPYPLHIFYGITLISEDYKTLKSVISEKFPDYYDAFINVMERNNKYSPRNMFVMKYDDFVKYCEWLFSVLGEVEKIVPYQYYNSAQKRVFAFMAERLLGVWCRKNNRKLKFFSVYFYEEGKIIKRPGIIRNAINFMSHLVGYLRKQLIATLLMHPKGKLW